MGKDFADRLRSGADLADVAVISNLFGGKYVLDEKHLVGLQAPRQLHRVHAAQVRVHIVNQLRPEAGFVAQILEQRRYGIDQLLLIKRGALVSAFRTIALPAGVKPPPP